MGKLDPDTLPWQWSEAEWRSIIHRVRAGRLKRGRTMHDARSRCLSTRTTTPMSFATAANQSAG